MIVFERQLAAFEICHQLVRIHILGHVLVKFELLPGQGIDERGNQLEETPNNPWHCCYSVSLRNMRVAVCALTVDDERAPKSLGIVGLKDIKYFATLTNARGGICALGTGFEVDE